MNTLYPDATPEELAQSDNICIICRYFDDVDELFAKFNRFNLLSGKTW